MKPAVGCAGLLCIFVLSCTSVQAKPETFYIDPERSTLEFFGKSTLHAFEGKTQALSGTLVYDLDEAKFIEASPIRMTVTSFKTGLDARDHALYHTFDAVHFPEILFYPTRVTPRPGWTREKAVFDMEGDIEIRGIRKHVSFSVEVTREGEGGLVSGQTHFEIDWFNLRPPSPFGFIRVNPHFEIKFNSYWSRKNA